VASRYWQPQYWQLTSSPQTAGHQPQLASRVAGIKPFDWAHRALRAIQQAQVGDYTLLFFNDILNSTPHSQPLPSERSFGRFWTIVFALVSGWLAWRGAAGWATVLALAALVVLGLTIGRPTALAPLNRSWATLGLALATIVNPLVMGVLYFGLLTPVGLVLQAFGRDILKMRRPRPDVSLWVEREADPRGQGSFKDQY
jgi:hypothetical protein